MPTEYENALASGATTLCRCFRLTRADGVVQGFTDHDEDVTALGLTFSAETALTASEAATSLGLAPDDMDAAGALSDDAITEADIVAGAYDGAVIEVFDVDWSDPSVSERLGVFTVGEIERGPMAFRAELRSRAAGLDRKVGRIVAPSCDATLGDDRCGVKLTPRPVTVSGVSGFDVMVVGLDGLAPDTFDRGVITWTDGPSAGHASDVRISRQAGNRVRVSLWRLPPGGVWMGDKGEITVGCDKSAAACKRFGNFANFRGFPHVPGETFMSEYVIPGDAGNTGGSRFD